VGHALKDGHQRLGSGVHADAISGRIVRNTMWVEAGDHIMQEHTARRVKP
jgi:translation initiation factor IF-1